ncbi:MAG: hypothetical protein WBM14_06575 [Terracidiphilus sp.]
MSRRLAVLVALLAIAPMAAQVSGQASGDSGATGQTPPSATHPNRVPTTQATRPAPAQGADNTAADTSCGGGPCSNQQPQIIVNPPAPALAPWTWHDRAAWGAGIVLAVLGYAGILLALRSLKIIERNTELGTATAQAALDNAQAALAQTQAIRDAERPWIVVRAEPSLTTENSFRVMATNRGRSPARIVAMTDQARIAVDDTNLPETPEYESARSGARPELIILLPSESVVLRAFSRDDVRSICKSEEDLERINHWEANIFLYGRVTYGDMIGSAEKPLYETSWCYWYIHGEQKSALTVAGPPEYNKHS